MVTKSTKALTSGNGLCRSTEAIKDLICLPSNEKQSEGYFLESKHAQKETVFTKTENKLAKG